MKFVYFSSVVHGLNIPRVRIPSDNIQNNITSNIWNTFIPATTAEISKIILKKLEQI